MMPTNNENDPEEVAREIRINKLKDKAQELTAGEMTAWESDECTPELAEQFWENVVAYEQAPWTTHFQRLEEAGMELPAPETLDDQELTAKLWELIDCLAQMRVFLDQTNHLSDRELYTLLWSDVLREETKAMPFDEDSAWHLDLLGSGSEEDTYLYLKYYADEDWRQRWLADFPDTQMPDHEDPPYDRDRHLPQATGGLLVNLEDDEPM